MCCHSDGRSATDAPDEHMLQHHVAVAVVSQDGDDFVVLSSSATLDSRVEHEMADARMYPHTTIEATGSSSKALWVRHSCQKKVYLEFWDGGVHAIHHPSAPRRSGAFNGLACTVQRGRGVAGRTSGGFGGGCGGQVSNATCGPGVRGGTAYDCAGAGRFSCRAYVCTVL